MNHDTLKLLQNHGAIVISQEKACCNSEHQHHHK